MEYYHSDMMLLTGEKTDNEGIIPGVDYINMGLEDQMVRFLTIWYFDTLILIDKNSVAFNVS